MVKDVIKVPGGLRFCPRCKSLLEFKNDERGIVYRCPRCGYEEVIPTKTIIKYSGNSNKPTVIADLKSSPELCPKCHSQLYLVHSHNLFFRYCPNCGYVESEFRPPSYELPVDPEMVSVWLENERVIAENNRKTIGYGDVAHWEILKGDPHIARVTMDVELLSEYASSLRPFDSVFIGNTLGVVEGVKVDIERRHKCRNKRGELCVDGQLIVHVQSNKRLSHGEIKLAEPSILYESAIRILKGSIDLSNGDCSLYGIIDGVTACRPNPQSFMPNPDLGKYSLDPEKVNTVREIINMKPYGLLAVEGPPGTGKTTVIAAAACELARAGYRVLITSHTNVAIDNALERIMDLCPGVKGTMARVGHPAKVSKRVKEVIATQEEGKRNFLWDVFRSKAIVGMTIAKLAVLDMVYSLEDFAKKELRRWPLFDYVFIDEASMVPLGIAIISIHYGLRRVILGDTRQLPPITRSPQHTEGAESILQLLVSSGEVPVIQLSVQRRGVEGIFKYISEAFYQGRLRTAYSGNPITFRARYNDVIDEALTSGSPILWVDVDGHTEWVEEKRGKYTSYSAINRDEACLAVAIYRRLREYGVGRDEIAIISTYRAQSTLIAKAVEKLHLDEPAIAYLVSTSESKDSEGVVDEEGVESLLDLRVSSTVDSFQGREKDIIIYSITADKYHKALANYARFNVAISRARKMLVLLSSMVEDDLRKLPWIHGLVRRSYRTSIDVGDAGNDVCRAVDKAISELWSA